MTKLETEEYIGSLAERLGGTRDEAIDALVMIARPWGVEGAALVIEHMRQQQREQQA